MTLQTERTTVKRLAKRGNYERETVHAILDEALICHVGFVIDGQPVVIPTIHWRDGDRLYLHGSAANRMLRTLRDSGVDACVTVTLLDALILARSAFHHSMNYRSVVIMGKAVAVTDREEKLHALDRLVEHVVPGRAPFVRPANDAELKQTLVLAIPIDEASAKVRTGGALDEDEDYALDVWAGVVPMRLVAGAPEPDEKMPPGVPVPEYLLGYRRG
ncbi:MAG TPA: pyridoxamine 5'-phosphate oxidase family protein [Thermoanaerobaculia bacterium]|jgi:hypothetical protein